MLTFDQKNNRFTYRTVAIFTNSNRVLLHTAEADDFWALPGGRVEHGESAHEALAREMKEELAIESVKTRPVWAVDNFFTYQEKHCHELGIYFETTTEATSYIYQADEFQGIESEVELLFKWFDIDSLGNIELYPSFLSHSLSNLPTEMKYICHRDA